MTDENAGGPVQGADYAHEVQAAAHLSFTARKQVESGLASELGQHLEIVAELAASDDLAVRRTVVELLRRNVDRNRQALDLCVLRLGQEPDIKTRRRLCVAIASSGQEGMADVLFSHLGKEEHRFVQASVILALGKLGFDAWPERWRRLAGQEGPVGEALQQALARVAKPRPEASRAIARQPGRYLLRIYPGSIELGRLEWDRAGLGSGQQRAPCWVEVMADSAERLHTLSTLRTVLLDFLVVAEGPESDLAALIASAIPTIVAITGRTRNFRLSLPRMRSRKAYSKTVRQVAGTIGKSTGWRNSPSNYDIDLRVERVECGVAVIWRDRSWPSARGQRTALPASIHPTIAAGLCLAATDQLEGPLVLLDPCCGAGTILQEWLALDCESALGFDRSLAAIATCRRNLELAKASDRALTGVGDLGDLPLARSDVSAVIANLPFNIRDRHGSSNRVLYRRFVDQAAQVLRPGGVLMAYTADRSAMTAALSEAGLAPTEPLLVVEAGGLQVGVYRVGMPDK